MKRFLAHLFCTVFVFTLSIAVEADAQNSETSPAVLSHVNAAKAVAYAPGNDLTTLFDAVCAPALDPKGPKEPNIQQKNDTRPPSGVRSDWHTPPGKAFDNLYYVGSPYQSTWAVTTSEGIILIDSGYDYSAKDLITDGLKKLGLDPTQIKYVILTHIHSDRIWGTPYLQKTYNAHVVMSQADWDTVAKTNDPPELKPKKDMVATDGMKLTLGDTTLTLYSTPGHTPGTTSIIVPLKDGKERHVGAIWGGINADMGRNGVQYFPTLADTFKTWIASAKKFQEITKKENADVYITLHPFYDKAIDKLHAMKFRKPGDPNPFVSKANVQNFLTIIRECTEAELARLSS
jgi:metallo-beta-lactamase class B